MDTIEARAVKIAARIMVADGLCRYESTDQCRRVYVGDGTCEKCLRQWLLSKARRELRRERIMIRLILREMLLGAAYFLLITAIMAALIPFAY